MPAEPWHVSTDAVMQQVARIPGRRVDAVVPTAYRATGPARTDWPFADGIAGFDVRVRSAQDVTVLPRRVAFDRHGKLLPLSLEQSNNFLIRVPLAGGYIFRDKLTFEQIRRIEKPVFVADACWATVYGHLLLEIIPMLALRSEVPSEALVLTTAPLTRTLFSTFEALGVARHQVRRITGPIQCAEAYWPDPLSRATAGVHPLIWTVYERLLDLGARSRGVHPERIFISRSGISSRPLRNQAEVEDLFVKKGFAIVHPERLPIEDQIAMFAGAKLIAGLGGSGMHNAVFAKPETPVLIVQTDAMSVYWDVSLSPLQRRLGYVFGTTDRSEWRFTAPWSVNVEDVAAGIESHFDI